MSTFLYIIGYFIMAIITGMVVYRFFTDEKETVILSALLWPFTLMLGYFLLCLAICVWVVSGIEYIWKLIEK